MLNLLLCCRFRSGRRTSLANPFQPHSAEHPARRGLYLRPGVITLEELQEKRAPAPEIEHLLATKPEEGDASNPPNRILYLKNLAKSVQESDLRYVFHVFFATEVSDTCTT